MKKIILASGSPRRKKLLQMLKLNFDVVVSGINENTISELPPHQLVQHLAARKAESVASDITDALVIGADTVVVLDNTVLEKPQDKSEAVSMLQQLSSRSHHVLSGVSLYKVDRDQNITATHTFYEQTAVTFGSLDETDIQRYVTSGSPMDKAGGYGIQDDFGAIFVKRINGDYYNVVGLPLYSLYKAMKSFAPEFLELPN